MIVRKHSLCGQLFDGRKHLVGEHEGLDGVEEVDEDHQHRQVLHPAPLQGLP